MAAWSILRLEVSRAARDSRLRFILLVTLVVAVVGGIVSGQDYRDRRNEFDARSAQLRSALATGGPMAVQSSDPGLRVIRPPEAASVLARGVDASLPTWWEFDPAGPVDGPADAAQGTDSEAGSISDVEGLVRVLLSLMAVVLGFEAVAGDRGRGVLQSVLNQPVSHRLVATAKLTAGVVVLCAGLLVITGVFLTTVSVVTPGIVDWSLMSVAVSVSVACLVYLTTLMASAMLMGALLVNPSACLVAIGAVWAYVAILGPQLTVLGSRALVPIPSRALLEIDRQRSFVSRLQATERSVGSEYRKLIGTASMGGFPTPKPGPDGIAALARQWNSEASVTRQIDEVFDERYAGLERQQARVRFWLMWLTPGSLLHEATADLADTGTAAHDRWRAAIWAHQKYLNAAFFDDPPFVTLLVPEPDGTRRSLQGIAFRSPLTWARNLAVLETARTPWRTRVVASLPELAGLLAYLMAVVLATYLAFPKAGV